MERLSFVLPDFTRIIWVSDEAKRVWAPRLQAVTRAWLGIEWKAIPAGLRACAITTIRPDELVQQSATWLDHGLSALPLEMQGAGGSYASTPVSVEPGKPFVYRMVVGRPDDLRTFRDAWLASHDATIGRLLGYPPCCTAFFRRVWIDEQMVDTTWPMAIATSGRGNTVTTSSVRGPFEANILWRWMGARAVPHLPCRFDCDATVALGRRFIEVGRAVGYGQEMDWLTEMLRWPVEWSALHGVAEIRTPVLKVSTRTDATPIKYVVQREGETYPDAGARGVRFPYRTPERPLMTASAAFQRGLAHPMTVVTPAQAWQAADNGFTTLSAMNRAHAPIVTFARTLLSDRSAAILDLGCGNGALLRAIRGDDRHNLVSFGIDIDAERIAHARESSDGGAQFWQGDIFESGAPWDGDRRYDLALFMPGRLMEVEASRTRALRSWLRTRCDRLLIYAYGDWLTRHGSLRGLAEAAGLQLEREAGPVGLAVVPNDSESPGESS